LSKPVRTLCHPSFFVIPAKAGIQYVYNSDTNLDPRRSMLLARSGAGDDIERLKRSFVIQNNYHLLFTNIPLYYRHMPEEKGALQEGAQPAEQPAEKEKTKLSVRERAKRAVDPITGMSGKEMAVGYWWVSHKLLLRKLGLSLLVAVCLILVGYSVYGWGTYYLYGRWKEAAMIEEMAQQPISFRAYHEARAPKDLEEGELAVLDSGTKEGWKDIIVPIVNLNPKWLATLTYYFEDGAETTPIEAMKVLPGQETHIGIMGFAPTSTVRNPILVRTETAWQKIDPHRITDPVAYVQERLNFTIDNIVIQRPGEIDNLDNYKVTFDITNNTIHSYWSVPLWVLMYRNDRLVGVEQVVINQLELGERRLVDLRSSIPNRRVTRVEVVPQLDVFDESIYMPIKDVFNDLAPS